MTDRFVTGARTGIAVALVSIAATTLALAQAAGGHYQSDAKKSTLDFNGFTAVVDFAPDKLATSKLDVTVTMASLDTADKDRDEQLKGDDLFAVSKNPQARFVATQITKSGDGYDAAGKLTLRGVTKDVHVPFTFRSASEAGATVGYLVGKTTIKRLDFGVGQGDWKNTGSDGIANDVVVSYSLRLLPH